MTGHSSAISVRTAPARDGTRARFVRLLRALPTVRVGIRPQVLSWFIVLLVCSGSVTALGWREALVGRLIADIDFELVQQTDEVARLANGLDPVTGQPFGDDAAAVYDLLFRRTVPDEGEAFYAIVGGQPFRQTDAPVSLFGDASLLAVWRTASTPILGEADTDAGPVRWRAVPLVEGDPRPGVFAVAFFEAARRAEIDQTIGTMLAMSAAVFLIVSLVAWLAVGHAVAPLRTLTATASGIGDGELGTRIPVAGADEVAQLTTTINAMLERLEGAFASQREFLDDVSHELRTPLTIIRGHLELIDEDPAERRRTVQVVLAQLDRMSRCVDDLLLLARAERPDFLRRGPVELRDLVTRLPALVRPLGDRDWRLALGPSGIIHADADRLTQAMVNLVTNAVRHTDQGDVIELGVSTDAAHARLWVRDEGTGIAPEDQKRIFRRFARGQDPTARRGEGTGLGLAIVDAIAVAHGGRTELESAVGVGSTFSLVIPLGSPPVGAAP